jgi:AraC family transcriptional regulator of adaptative response/methylated-DNA-[protein]-cysteine methyltransferase
MNEMTQTDSTSGSAAYHFGVVARAIEAIDACARRGEPAPSLERLAAEMRMSPAHFQRVFSLWAGISPKRLAQYLALGHAKAMLAGSTPTLAAAEAAGLSGSGRLHDLFVRWEAMTPGQWARGAADLPLSYAWCDTPFGEALAVASPRGLAGLAFSAELGREAAFADMAARWPGASLREDARTVAPVLEAAMGGRARLHVVGAPFQIKVWEALMRVPSGQVTTYGALAAAVGNPRAVRAVGTAVGRNPVSFLIPCHRALRKTGALGGYHWGLPVKRAMLAWEAAQAGRAEADRSEADRSETGAA